MKKLLSKLDKPLLVVTFIFFIFGLIMILSASSMESYMRYNYSPYHYFLRHAIFLVLCPRNGNPIKASIITPIIKISNFL